MKKRTLILTLAATLALFSCKKQPGKGGKAAVNGTVTYTDKSGSKSPASGATVYIIYDETYDTKSYDDSITVETDGKYEFTELRKGQYYLLAKYFSVTDSANAEKGFPINIEKRKETKEADIDLEF